MACMVTAHCCMVTIQLGLDARAAQQQNPGPELQLHMGRGVRTPEQPGETTVTHRTDQHDSRPSPAHNSRTCQLCSVFRHPAQATQGRALAKHLKTNPLPRQAARV